LYFKILPIYGNILCGGGFKDLFFEETTGLSLYWEEGKLENVSNIENTGVGVRHLLGDETRYGYINCPAPVSEDLRRSDLERLKKLAEKIIPEVKNKQKLRGCLKAPRIECVKHKILLYPDSVDIKSKAEMLNSAFKAVKDEPFISQITFYYGEKIKKVAYVNSIEDSFCEERVYVTFVVTVTCKRGKLLQSAQEVVGGICGFEFFKQNSAVEIAKRVYKRAKAKLSAVPAPVGEMPVVIASRAGGTMIHEAIGHSLELDAVIQGISPRFAGKVGKKVASDLVTVIDDPTLPNYRGSYFFDDEGVKSQKTVLVENGILRDFLKDRKSAVKEKSSPNGHGRRESFESKPIPRMSNTYIQKGSEDPEAIIKSLKKGLFVTKMGGGQVDTATGDFVFEVEEGFKIKDGEIKELVKDATLLGNGPDVLLSVDAVGNDLGWGIGSCGKDGQYIPVTDGLPTIRIPKLLVGGTEKSR